jgi:uncharacterized radical SAM superfamily Fe-S cluster-containing enzyme
MNQKTMSMCEYCYRHIPAIKFERDGAIWLGKTCKAHGYHERVVDANAEFYNSQIYEKSHIYVYTIGINFT